jgi:hypothetical protein
MTNDQIEINRLKGELVLEGKAIEWWAEEMLFWRTKYLLEHPDQANYDYVSTAREDEKLDPFIFIPPDIDLKDV